MFYAALRISLSRTRNNIRLTLAVVTGVIVAVAIMATTVVYFEALRDVALSRSLDSAEQSSLDLLVGADQLTLNPGSDRNLRGRVEGGLNEQIRSFAPEQSLAVQSWTFLMAGPPVLVPLGECPCRPNGIASGPDDVPGVAEDGSPDPRAGSALLSCDCRRASLMTLPSLTNDVEIISGRAPSVASPPADDGPVLTVEALLDAATAERFGLSVGDSLPVRPYWESRREGVEIVVSGLYERAEPDATFWRIYEEEFGILTESIQFAQFVVPDETLVNVVGPFLPNMGARYAWLLDVDPARIHATDTGNIREVIRRSQVSLRSELDGFRVISGLPRSLEEFEVNLFFNRVPMLIVLALVVAVSLYYAGLLASILVTTQRVEIALLRSRGAASLQVFGVFTIEAMLLAVLAFVLGPLISLGAVSLIGQLPIYSDLNNGDALPVQLTRNVFMAAGIGALISFIVLLIPAYRATRLSVLGERRQRGRPGRLSIIQRYYLDLGVLGLVALLFWQLARQGSFVATDVFGQNSVNNLTLAVPAMMLVFASVALLRLFPLVMEGVVRLLSSRAGSAITPPALVLGIWQMARNPGHHARISLLLVLTAALGVFAATFAATLERSAREQVLYDTGAEFRVTGVSHTTGFRSIGAANELATVDGLGKLASVHRARGVSDDLIALGAAGEFTALGIETDEIADVAWYRADFSGGPLEKLADSIAPEVEPGLPLPPNSWYISARIRSLVRNPDAILVARMSDSNGRFYSIPIGNLLPESSDNNRFHCPIRDAEATPDWCRLGSSLSPSPRDGFSTLAPRTPVTLHSIGLISTSGPLAPGTLLIDDISVLDNLGQVQTVVEDFDSLGAWRTLDPSENSLADSLEFAIDQNGDPVPGIAVFRWSDTAAREYRGLAYGASTPAVPVVASPSFLRAREATVGDELAVVINGVRVRLLIADEVTYFPTLNNERAPFVVIDLDTLIARLNLGRISLDEQPNEYWLTGVTPEEQAEGEDVLTARAISIAMGGFGRLGGISLGRITSGPILERDTALQAVNVDPLVTTGWEALLGIAFVTVLAMSAVGYLVHARVSFQERRSELALFRTVGLSRLQLFVLIVIEQLLVIGVAVAAGAFLGARLGDTIFPFLAESTREGSLAPPMIIEIDPSGIAVIFGVLAAVMGIVIAAILRSVSKMAVHSVMRAGER